MTTGSVRIGIGGWTYPPWRNVFYPNNLKQSHELEYASNQFTTLEINATFYGRQAPKSWQSWAATVPDGFQFAVKASRFCVTRPKLSDAGEGIANFLAQGLVALGEKLGPILWMLSPSRKFDREDIAGFLKLLPPKLDDLSLRHAIEPRHESFRDEQFFSLCRDHDVAIVYGDDDEFPCIDAQTASFSYARLQRMKEELETGYDAKAIKGFADRARQWSEHGRDSYIYMINGAKVRAPAAAAALRDNLQMQSP